MILGRVYIQSGDLALFDGVNDGTTPRQEHYIKSPHLTTVDTVPYTDNEDMRPDGRKFALIHFARDPQIRHGHRPSVCHTCCASVLRSAPIGAVEFRLALFRSRKKL